MFFLTQYIEVIKNQFTLYDWPASWPSETVVDATTFESKSLTEIERLLSDYEKMQTIPLNELKYLLGRAESVISSLSEEEKEEDRVEIERILTRITHLRSELTSMRDDVAKIADDLGDWSETEAVENYNDHIIRHSVHSIWSDVRSISSNEVHREYTSEEISRLEDIRASRKEKVQEMLSSVLWDQYTGGGISNYTGNFQESPVEVYFDRYMRVVSQEANERWDIHQTWSLLSDDISELNSIMQDMSISLRDASMIDGEEFWKRRSESLIASYNELLASTDEKILDIVSPKWENGERVPKDIDQLTNADILSLQDNGYDPRVLFFIGSDGKNFDPKTLAVWSAFVINIWENRDASILGLHHLEHRPNIIIVDGIRAEYNQEWENGSGYYWENGRVELVDGMEVKVLEMWDAATDTQRTDWNQEERNHEMQQSTAREIYRQALQNPNQPIKAKGLLEKFILAILNALFWKDQVMQDNWVFQIRNASWWFSPVIGQQFMEKYTWSIQSYPIEYTASWTTACGRTAYKNLKMLWAKNPRNGNAHDLAKEYWSRLSPNLDFPSVPNSVDGPLQLFLDASRKNAAKWYRHTAVAFKDTKGNWQVLDPYYGMNGKWTATRNPIPAGVYMNYMRGTLGKNFHGAFAI